MKIIKKLFYVSLFTVYFVYLCIIGLVNGGKLNEATNALNPNWSYCFEFTWFGPEYDNTTMYNGTCEEYLDETRAVGIPCNPPIVITYNGTFPDMDYLWKYHTNSIVCRRSNSQVCARYTYSYNGAMVNATYMCTKAQVVGEEAINKGCFKQKNEGYDVEVCVCESGKGIYKPCNLF